MIDFVRIQDYLWPRISTEIQETTVAHGHQQNCGPIEQNLNINKKLRISENR